MLQRCFMVLSVYRWWTLSSAWPEIASSLTVPTAPFHAVSRSFLTLAEYNFHCQNFFFLCKFPTFLLFVCFVSPRNCLPDSLCPPGQHQLSRRKTFMWSFTSYVFLVTVVRISKLDNDPHPCPQQTATPWQGFSARQPLGRHLAICCCGRFVLRCCHSSMSLI